MEQIQEHNIFLQEFADIVESLSSFFDEECPNEIVKYKSDWSIIEPAYCRDGRINHNKNIGSSGNSCRVVKEYNIRILPREEDQTNTEIITIFLSNSEEEIGEEKEDSFNFNEYIFRGSNQSIKRLEKKMTNLSLEGKRRSIPKQVQDLLWIKYEPKNSTIGKCYSCGVEIRLVPRNYDAGHVISRYNGGSDEISNLRPICRSCNLSMGTRDMSEYMKTYGYDKTNSDCFLTL
jgi:HNH endonuclease